MARRGFLATLAHQARVAAREQERARRVAVREHKAAIRRAEQAIRTAARVQAQLSRATEAERKRLEKEAREAHIDAKEAEAESRNHELAEIYDEIDSLLAATVDVDNYIDLEQFRVVVKHPPFDRQDLQAETPAPWPATDPPEPPLVLPVPPTGFAKFFGKKRHAAEIAKAHETHARALEEWRTAVQDHRTRQQQALEAHEQAEATRKATLASEQARYAQECAAREAEAAQRNKQLDELIAHLAYGTVDAVEEYVSIVLSNSVYPEHFKVTHEYDFQPSSSELILRVLVPGPHSIPDVKGYRFNRSTDEIVASSLPQKVCRDRYASAVHQVALRSIHEVFESDRRGVIKTISLEVGTKAVDPATGRPTYVPFVRAGAEREAFLSFDLSAVVPALTLDRLGASVSKDPYKLIPAEESGVRRA